MRALHDEDADGVIWCLLAGEDAGHIARNLTCCSVRSRTNFDWVGRMGEY